jgi:dCMP deaminase
MDKTFLRFAQRVADLSKDPSTKVGAVLVKDGDVAAVGFNRFPDGHPDLPEHYADRAYKYQYIVHAEVIALNNTSRETANGATLYTSFPCCPDCVERAAEAGVSRIVHPPLPTLGRSALWVGEWTQRLIRSREVAARHGIALEVLEVLNE